jgi:hypothetical protein
MKLSAIFFMLLLAVVILAFLFVPACQEGTWKDYLSKDKYSEISEQAKSIVSGNEIIEQNITEIPEVVI